MAKHGINITNFKSSICSYLTETWLNPINYECYSMHGYIMESRHRCNTTGGGVGLLIKQNLMYKQRHDLCEFSDKVESLFIEIFHSEVMGN